MGQFLASLNLRSCVPEIGFDIENAAPSSEEEELGYNHLFTLLVLPNSTLLKFLKEYQPASEYIRLAISTPNPENEDKAWNAVLPTVAMLREFYSYSSELEKGIPMLLNMLCKDGVTKDLDRHPGLTRLFADILDFAFEFDNLKIQNPTIQNDFSFYRRTLQRGRTSNVENSTTSSKEEESELRSALNEDDLANRISLFIAYPTPMLKCVIETTTTYVQANRLTKSVTEWLSSIWTVCYQSLNNSCKKKTTQQTTNNIPFLSKVMVITIVLFDRIDSNGTTHKSSPINVKNSIKIIESANQQAHQTKSTTDFISSLKHILNSNLASKGK